MGLPWFRWWADAIDDPKLKLLSFEDRWHYVAVCCLKRKGELDKEVGDQLRERIVATSLGLTVSEADSVRKRLMEVGLIDEAWHPKAWGKRQYDGPAKLPEGESLDGYKGYVYFIGSRQGPIKIGYSKNPWARLKDFQTGSVEELSVLATVKTTEVSERRVHELFETEAVAGEWFAREPVITKTIKAIKNKKIRTQDDLYSYVERLRSNAVATTTDTDSDPDPREFNPAREGEDLDPGGGLGSGSLAPRPS